MSYGNKVNANFQGKKVSRENASCKCVSLIILDSVIGVNKKYYPETLLEDCKYETKKNEMKNLINNYLGSGSSDESDNEPISDPDSELHS